METKTPLTVVILAKNEADRIGECLRSVAWAAETLVIDDNSTDATASIASQLGARVLKRAMDNEGRHRNWAHTQASNEWILSLDADERATPELVQEIQQLFLRGETPFETYAIPRRTFMGSRWIRHGGWYPSAQLKMFKRSVLKWEETTVHPRAFSEKACGVLRNDIIHYSYRDLQDFIGKMNRHTSLEAQKWVADRRKMPLGKALWRTFDRFFRAYLMKGGWRDGFLGFVLAALGGSYQFISYAKYLEYTQAANAAALKPDAARA